MVIGLDKFREQFAGEEGIERDAILEYMEQLKEMFV